MDAQEAFSDPQVAELANAAVAGDATRVDALVSSGVSLSAQGDKQVTLLQWALLARSARGMHILLDAGADPAQPGMDSDTAVHLAAMVNDPQYLDILLARGVDPDIRNPETQATPLFSALLGKRAEQFATLVAAGADLEATDIGNNTPLHQAALYSDPVRVLALLEAGANPHAKNVQDVTFQRYLFMTPDRVLSDEARSGHEAVRNWLRAHNIPIEDGHAR